MIKVNPERGSTGPSQHQFARAPQAEIERSKFDRSHGIKTTMDSGYLVPIFVDEALPGDTFALNATLFARMQTAIHPYMDNMYMDLFWFAIPYRLVWDNWVKFNGEKEPGDSTVYTIPTMTSPGGGYAIGSLSDYLGLPTGVAGVVHSSLWHRCYNLCFNTWFRDQNLQNSVTVDKGNGPDTPGNYVLLRRGKRHDYFTSCLPWPQKGTAVSLPLGTTAPVYGIGATAVANTAVGSTVYDSNGVTWPGGTYVYAASVGGNVNLRDAVNSSGTAGTGGHRPNVYADLSAATAATINDLRLAFQTQRMLERDARGGTRYVEVIKSQFGVTSPDARLQRPELLGTSTISIHQSVVPQTSATSGSNYQANLASFGTAAGQSGFVKGFTEHCLLLGLAQIRADLTYQEGLPRMFSRSTRYDFYWPALAHLGEQAVLAKEIYCIADSHDADVFGYQERYAEYRYKPSQVTGKFRSSAAGTLDMWHLAQKFSPTRPTLDTTFIQDTPPVSRVVADTTNPQFYVDGFIKLICARPMPVYSVPGLIDHF